MKRRSASEFPQLERVFSGYLHEDFAVDYATPEAALRAFRDDASPAEWRRFQHEAKRLADFANQRGLDDVRQLLQRLGSRWMPPSREALMELLAGVQGD